MISFFFRHFNYSFFDNIILVRFVRVFYLFQIKKDILKEYKYKEGELYKLLKSIHYLKTEDIVLGYKIYNNIVNPIDKDDYNNFIKSKNKNKDSYIFYNYIHTINDFYFNESTKLIINNSFLKIKTNINIPSFFYDLRVFDNIFVCDFNNNDYFLLSDTVYSPLK